MNEIELIEDNANAEYSAPEKYDTMAFFAETSPTVDGTSPGGPMNSVICIFESPKNAIPISIVSAAKTIV